MASYPVNSNFGHMVHRLDTIIKPTDNARHFYVNGRIHYASDARKSPSQTQISR